MMGDGTITLPIARQSLDRLEIDGLGLDAIDRRMLLTIIRNYGGGPVGLETLAAAIGEEAVTLEDVYEPYLMQIGFLKPHAPRALCDSHGIPASGDCRPGGRKRRPAETGFVIKEQSYGEIVWNGRHPRSC